jgi:hypothetical protein
MAAEVERIEKGRYRIVGTAIEIIKHSEERPHDWRAKRFGHMRGTTIDTWWTAIDTATGYEAAPPTCTGNYFKTIKAAVDFVEHHYLPTITN